MLNGAGFAPGSIAGSEASGGGCIMGAETSVNSKLV